MNMKRESLMFQKRKCGCCDCCKSKAAEEKMQSFYSGIFLASFIVVLAYYYEVWRFV